jgi:NAD(P)-dependent dehydrogenase (short-subunit alcohol dehydrogenase family)
MANGYAAHGIRVNCVVPGFIDTPLNAPVMADPRMVEDLCRPIPLRRPGQPREVASLFAWLASDEASYVTGAFFVADGGHTAV